MLPHLFIYFSLFPPFLLQLSLFLSLFFSLALHPHSPNYPVSPFSSILSRHTCTPFHSPPFSLTFITPFLHLYFIFISFQSFFLHFRILPFILTITITLSSHVFLHSHLTLSPSPSVSESFFTSTQHTFVFLLPSFLPFATQGAMARKCITT